MDTSVDRFFGYGPEPDFGAEHIAGYPYEYDSKTWKLAKNCDLCSVQNLILLSRISFFLSKNLFFIKKVLKKWKIEKKIAGTPKIHFLY